MKHRILYLVYTYSVFILFFIYNKVAFAYINTKAYLPFGDLLDILYHGQPLDLSIGGYLMILPAILTIVSIWTQSSMLKNILRVYFTIVVLVISVVSVSDTITYSYWGFHFDASALAYLKNISEVTGSATVKQLVVGVLFSVISFVIFYKSLVLLISPYMLSALKIPTKKKVVFTSILLLITASLILPIRGGVKTSTMNVGQAYFSSNTFYNHAAINPVFNLLYSWTKNQKFEEQYQFLDKDDARTIFRQLYVHNPSGTKYLLKTKRPNIILFILESFSAVVAYDSVVAPNLSKLAKGGINFSNFYANSYRTDRGVPSVLSGYPAHPTVAMLRYPKKIETLPSIPKALVNEGYQSAYYYGGDNDFGSMRSYIVGACSTDRIYEDRDFPLTQRLTKWGVPDEYVFQKLFKDISSNSYKEPFIVSMLTLSSHEPFDVPNKDFEDPFLNSVHYTDACIGQFMDSLKQTPYWDNTLVVFLADHCMGSYPSGVEHYSKKRFHIPMIWSGGAVAQHQEIKDFATQADLAATLLGQMDINYSKFKFSKNILSPKENKFGFYSYNNGFSFFDEKGSVIYDNDSENIIEQTGEDYTDKAKAIFQEMYRDLGER